MLITSKFHWVTSSRQRPIYSSVNELPRIVLLSRDFPVLLSMASAYCAAVVVCACVCECIVGVESECGGWEWWVNVVGCGCDGCGQEVMDECCV